MKVNFDPRKFLSTALIIVAGNALLAFAVAAFIIPQDIIMGGVTGVGVVFSRVLPFETAVIVLVLNIASLVLGLVVLGPAFLMTTVASSLMYPVFLGIMQRIPGIDAFTEDKMLASLLGGALVGIAVGMVMRVGSSTGGTDVVNLVLHKWTHLPVSVMVYLTDFVILGGQALFAEPESILYGLVLLVVETIALDKVMLLGQSQIQILVISSSFDEIRRQLLDQLHAGVTMLCIETGLTGQEQRGVLCVIPPRKLFAAKGLIQSVDPSAFLTITQIKEVRGEGFTSERHDKRKD